MKHLLSIIPAAILWLAPLPALADALGGSVGELLKEPVRLVAEWESERSIAFGLVAVVFILGAVIAIVHAFPTHTAKILAVVLGSAVTLLTGLSNSYFDFDHRQYKAMASEGRTLLAEIRIKAEMLKEMPPDPKSAREAIVEEIRTLTNIIRDLPSSRKELHAVYPGQPANASARLLDLVVSPALAEQGAAPGWITKVPVDEANLYFVGYSDGRDYVTVRQAADQSARDEARAFLAGRLDTPVKAQGVDSASAAKYLLELRQGARGVSFVYLAGLEHESRGIRLEAFRRKDQSACVCRSAAIAPDCSAKAGRLSFKPCAGLRARDGESAVEPVHRAVRQVRPRAQVASGRSLSRCNCPAQGASPREARFLPWVVQSCSGPGRAGRRRRSNCRIRTGH